MEVDSLKKENHCYGGGQFKGGRMVVTEVLFYFFLFIYFFLKGP